MKTKKSAILFILIFAFIIRLYNINYGLPNKERLFYYFPNISLSSVEEKNLEVYRMLGTPNADEVDILGAISNFEPSKLNFNPKYFYWGCLYFYIVALVLQFFSFFGIVMLVPKIDYFVHVEEFARLFIVGRMTTIILSLITITILYMIGKKIFGEKVGLLSAFLLSCHPIFLDYSRAMLPDMLMILFGMLTLYFGLQMKDKENILTYYLLMGISLGLAAGAKYHGCLFLCPVLFFHYLKTKDQQSALLNKNLMLLIFTAFLAFFSVNPYLLIDFNTAKHQIFGLANKGADLLFNFSNFNPLIYFKNIFIEVPKYLHSGGYGIYIFLLFIFSILYGIFGKSRDGKALAILPLTFYIVLGMTQVSVLREHIVRYFLPSLPIVILLGTAFVFQWTAKMGRLTSKFITICIILIGIMSSSNFLSKEYYISHTDPRLIAAEWIFKNIEPSVSIGVANKNYYMSPPISSLRYNLKEVRLPSELPGQDLDYFVILEKMHLAQFQPYLRTKFNIIKTIEKEARPKFLFSNREHAKVIVFKKKDETNKDAH